MNHLEASKSTRQDIRDKVSGVLQARIDWDNRKIYLWSKIEKAWQEHDLAQLEQDYRNSDQHIA